MTTSEWQLCSGNLPSEYETVVLKCKTNDRAFGFRRGDTWLQILPENNQASQIIAGRVFDSLIQRMDRGETITRQDLVALRSSTPLVTRVVKIHPTWFATIKD